jgi:integrase
VRKRHLPKYVTSFRDRHGKTRLRFRRKGYPSHYFVAPLGTEEFRTEYRLCELSAPQPAGKCAAPGTIGDLVAQYFVPVTRLGPTPTTQAKVRAIIDNFRLEHGHRVVAEVKFNHIDAIIAAKREKVMKNGRMVGGDEAARKLRKELTRLFDFAIKLEMRTTNPVAQSDKVRVAPGKKSLGFHTWTEAEIAQYRSHHKVGSKARLAMELMLWTGQRRIDAIRMGRQHIKDGRIEFAQSKTGTGLKIPVAPQLLEAIVAMPADPNRPSFLVTEYGKPFSNAGFGNWFRAQCDAADLPQCTAHGLRKAVMRRMAELHMGNQSLKSVSGHKGDSEVATYTREVDQMAMADTAMAALSRWERSNLCDKVDTHSNESTANA